MIDHLADGPGTSHLDIANVCIDSIASEASLAAPFAAVPPGHAAAAPGKRYEARHDKP